MVSSLYDQTMRACVKKYLQDIDSLIQVEPKLVRKWIAETCFKELTEFSDYVKNFISTEHPSEVMLKALMNLNQFDHIPGRFKKTYSFGQRAQQSKMLQRRWLFILKSLM